MSPPGDAAGARQTRLMSAIEAVTNVIVGYIVAVAANQLVLPLFGFAVSMGDSAAIGLVFTGVAVIRGFALRRLLTLSASAHAPEAIRVGSRETGDS